MIRLHPPLSPSPLIGVIGYALTALVIGCGGKVIIDPAGTSGGGGASGSGSGPGSSATSTGTGGGQCGATSDGFTMELHTADGSVWGCGLDAPSKLGDLELTASVVDSSAGSLTL